MTIDSVITAWDQADPAAIHPTRGIMTLGKSKGACARL